MSQPAALSPETDQKPDMADLPAQHPAAPHSRAEARARYFNSGNAFNIKLPPVPSRLFTQEPARALADGATTGFIPCDQSDAIACAFPATTPLMLARYAVVAAGARFTVDLRATGSIWYVIAGRGQVDCLGESLSVAPGDVFLLPGSPARITAGAEQLVMWVVSNEPQLALNGDLPPDESRRPVAVVHYPAAEIARQVDIIYDHAQNAQTSGIALIFSSEPQAAARNILPSLTLSLNTLPPGEHQRAHRHNSAAITLVLQGENCHSMVDGVRCPWSQWATLVTPPGAPHSHHNAGSERALFLIVQDGGLHYHARTMGFSFLE